MSRGRFARRSLLASLVTVAALVASASPASASVTLGQLSPDPSTSFCFGPMDEAQPTVTSGNTYVVPETGTITSWSHNARVGAGQTFTMKVFRKIAEPGTYMVVGHDGPRPLAASALNTFPASIPVKPGDVLGFNNESPVATSCGFPVTGESYLFRNGNLADGESDAFSSFPGFRLNISAVVEPDCDNDGLGDETQDQNLASCAPGTIPPPAPGTATATCKGLPATIVGTDGNDVRSGSQGQDVIAGLGGNDALSGLGGNDVICGGPGRDTLKGGKGKDTLLGQKGKDALNGGPSRDLCKGGKGNDTASKCEVEKSI
jgi:RTX calcium-binding nonapeptide repeat (4 copies)